MSQSYLQMRGKTSYKIVGVPKSLRTFVSRPRYLKSLETDSLAVANRKKVALVSKWKRQIDVAARQGKPDPLAKLSSEMVETREAMRDSPDRW